MVPVGTDETPILEHEVVVELIGEWSIEVGRRLRKRRKELGMTLAQVASLTGLSRQTIHRAEYDAATTRDEARHLIACALASEVDQLWSPMSCAEMRRRAKSVA